MIPDNSRKKLEQLRQEAALRAQLTQQYDKDMKKVPLEQMIPFSQWMDKRPKPMAKGGSTSISIKDLEAYIKQKRGEFAAKRVQRAADEIPNLENMYTAGALKEAFEKKNAGLMTMNPADFEKFAERMREDITSKKAKRKTRDEKVVSFDDYLKHLAQLQSGFDEVPFLELGHRDAEYLPSIEGHEGRHRSRVLTAKGANKSLVQLLPTQRMVLPMPKSNSEKLIKNLQKTLGENRYVSPEGGGLLPSDQTAGMYKWMKDNNFLDTNRPQLPEVYAEGGTVNAFDYENPKHVENVASIASKHKDFSKIPDVAKHLAGALSQGSYKFIEDPRIQSAISKAGHSGYFINGKEGKQQIVRKATGGIVNPIDQMKMELANKNRFKGLSQLQSIGAEEAPSLGVKAYVPTIGRPDNGQMPVGGVDTSKGDLPVGGIDMSKMQQGQQLMPTPAGQQQGMDQVPAGDKIPTMDGTGMPPNPNANPNQMGSNILSMTPQGQAMAAMKPQGLAKGGQPKVEVRPTVKDDAATRRTPEIETAVKALAAGIINQKEYDRIVQKHKPVKPYSFVPAPATDEQAMKVLIDRQKKSWRSHEGWPAGHPVGLRLDIPAYERQGVWVNSIHDESGRGKEGFPVSYGPVSAVRNATFEGTPHKAMRVATGEQTKTPFAKIMGELEHIDEKKAVSHMKKYLNHPEYRQIGYDPRRHGDFYDRETMQPVQSAEHVVQIGPLVLAKNPVYSKKRTQYATGGTATKGYVKSTPKKPHPEVGKRFTATPQGNLVAPQVFDIMKQEGKGSIVPVPYDATTRDNRVTEVSGHQLTEPLVTEAGFDYAMDPIHVAQKIGGASNLGIAGRVQDRINQAAREHEGDVYLAPNTMSEKAENFSHHPAHIVLDLMKQRQLNKKTLKALSDDLRSQAEIHPTTKKKIFPYKNFVGFDHPNLGEQVMKGGHGLETTAGNLRKKMMDRLSLVNIQELLDYNLGDLKAAILHPDIASDPKGYMGRTLVKAQAGAPLRLSRHKSYDTDYTGTYAGGFGNRPIETVMPDLFEEVEAELRQRPVKKAKTDTEYRNQVIGALEKRKERVAQPINARVINNAGLYEEGLKNGEFDPKNLESVLAYYKRKGGYKAGGKVTLHTDQDTMQLALSKKSKKAK